MAFLIVMMIFGLIVIVAVLVGGAFKSLYSAIFGESEYCKFKAKTSNTKIFKANGEYFIRRGWVFYEYLYVFGNRTSVIKIDDTWVRWYTERDSRETIGCYKTPDINAIGKIYDYFVLKTHLSSKPIDIERY